MALGCAVVCTPTDIVKAWVKERGAETREWNAPLHHHRGAERRWQDHFRPGVPPCLRQYHPFRERGSHFRRFVALAPRDGSHCGRAALFEGTRPPRTSPQGFCLREHAEWTGLCSPIERMEDGRLSYRNCLSEAAVSTHRPQPDYGKSPSGRPRCAHTRCSAAVCAQLGEFSNDLSAACRLMVGLR